MNPVTTTGGCLIVYTNAAADRDAEFNRWYDEVHIPEILALEPFTGAQRFSLGAVQAFAQPHRYVALYAFEGSAETALETLMSAADTMTMSDAVVEPFMSVGTAITPPFTARP